MKKWYNVQFVILICLNILIVLFTIVGEILIGKEYLYKIETFTISMALLVLSSMIKILSDIYLNSNPKN